MVPVTTTMTVGGEARIWDLDVAQMKFTVIAKNFDEDITDVEIAVTGSEADLDTLETLNSISPIE